MKVYILANGEAKRWGNYRNCDKQLIPINGEPILERTVRLLKEEGLKKSEIIICGKYKIKGSTNIITKSKTKREVFEEISNLTDDEFIILYGDCYYTEAIIHDLVTRKLKQYGEWFNISPNPNTGKKWAEGYAHKIVDVEWFKNEIAELNRKVKNGELSYTTDWTIHWWLLGERDNFNRHPQQCVDKEKDIYWCDETDDFDFPTDYEHFLQATGYKGLENSWVSVIIPYYKSKQWCEPLLDKLVYQKNKYYPETEIILIHDDPEEDSSWLDRFKDDVKIFKNEENKGVSYARNVGLDNSNGDYIQFVDSDDDITDDFLHIIYTNIRKGYDYCLYRWVFDDKVTEGDIHKDSLLWNWAVWGYTLTRATIGNVRFDEKLRHGEDIDFLRKIIYAHLNRCLVDKPIYIYNLKNENSITHKINRGEKLI